MLRVACTLALLLFAPIAAAAPTVQVTIGPGEGYYLKVTATQPEAPHESREPKDDCAAESGRPGTADQGARGVVAPFQENPPPFTESGTTRPYMPDCVSAPATLCIIPGALCAIVPGTYASYDVSSGRYYVELPVGAAGTPLGPRLANHGGAHLTGTTGVSGEGDCEACPPPFTLS